eukprot:9609921-Lingulodinium_polyedra.AAC.1
MAGGPVERNAAPGAACPPSPSSLFSSAASGPPARSPLPARVGGGATRANSDESCDKQLLLRSPRE